MSKSMKIVLDACCMNKKEEAHAYLKEKMNFPEYYGNNLDALYDCLTELSDTEIVILHSCEAKEYYPQIEKLIRRAAEANDGLRISFDNLRLMEIIKEKGGDGMLEFKYDTQLLIEGEDLDEDAISDYFTEHFKGDCLLAVGDEELIKIHFHTNEPWKVLEYCASIGEIYDIVVEDMDRQSRGLKG